MPDPDWVDIKRLPEMTNFQYFTPPLQLRNDMLAQRETWAPGVESRVQIALVNVVSNIVAPRIIDLDAWRNHVAEFFGRLCKHRQCVAKDRAADVVANDIKHRRSLKVMEELKSQQLELEERIHTLEEITDELSKRLHAIGLSWSSDIKENNESVTSIIKFR